MPPVHTSLEVDKDALRNAHAMCKDAQTIYRAQADRASTIHQHGGVSGFNVAAGLRA